MKPLLSRCPQGRWTNPSSASGLTGIRKQRSSSFSSASSCPTQGTWEEPRGLLLPQWCQHLQSLSLLHQRCHLHHSYQALLHRRRNQKQVKCTFQFFYCYCGNKCA